MRARTQFICQQCGYAAAKWIGRCPSCQSWHTLVEERVEHAAPGVNPQWAASPALFDEIPAAEIPRMPTGVVEFDRVLGGGIVPGALTLLGGDPGVGKSTLMLDVAARLAAV